MLCFSGHVLYALGQPYELSFNTQYFIRLSIVSFYGQLHYDINRRYLSSIGMRSSQVSIPYITLGLHGLWCYIFLNLMELKIEGAAIVQILQFWMNYVICEIIIRRSRANDHLHSFTKESFNNWKNMAVDGIPSVIYEIVTVISYEASTFVAGFISVELVMVNSAYINMFWLFYVMATGVQHTSSSIIGNKVGAGDVEGTKKYIKANIVFALFYGILVVLVLNIFPDYILTRYTSNPETIVLMKSILTSFSSMIFLMIMKDIMFGIIIGLGLQKLTTQLNIYLNLVWVVLMYTLTFGFKFYANGPWLSICSVAAVAIYYVYGIIKK